MANIWLRVFPPEPQSHDEFTGIPSTHNMPPPNSTPIAYFNLLFTFGLMQEFIRQTNRYARHFISTHVLRTNSRARLWKGMTISDFKKFLAIIFNMGLNKKVNIEEYWNTKTASQGSRWFNEVMPRNKFQNILKFLHISDYRNAHPRQHPGYDPAARFRPLLNFINSRFLRFVTPKRELCVDETLVQSRGQTTMKQYIPSKRAKFGVKFWMLCEAATGYILQMTVYRGRHFDPVPRGQLQGTEVVHNLLYQSSLLNKGYHVFCDSFFSSINLARRLLDHRTFVTGTLRKTRPMPMFIKNANPQPDSPEYMRNGKILCMAYKNAPEKKTVRMMSTLLPAQQIPNRRPWIVQSYNKYMGAVDLTDASMSIYSGLRKNRKTWKKIIIHLLHRILHNSYILYSNNTTDRPVKTKLKFIQAIIESLSGLYYQARRVPRRQRIHTVLLPRRQERDCCVCSNRSQGIRRRSRTVCSLCGRGLHRQCIARHGQCIET